MKKLFAGMAKTETLSTNRKVFEHLPNMKNTLPNIDFFLTRFAAFFMNCQNMSVPHANSE